MQDPHPEHDKGHAWQYRGKIVYRAKDANKPELLVHQQGQHETPSQFHRNVDAGVDGGDLERLPEEGVTGEHLFVVLQADELGRGEEIPPGEADEQRRQHRPQHEKQKAYQPGRDQQVEGPCFALG